MLVDCDLHIHSKFSAATSKDMELKLVAEQAALKGIGIVGTADALHPKWLDSIKELNQVDEGTFEWKNTRFILTSEIEDRDQVHHILLFPSLSSVSDFRTSIKNFSKNLDTDGRPNVNLKGEAIARIAKDVDALIGPAHIFTPWTALFKSFSSLRDCYGSMYKEITFAELGLSADTFMADQISELASLTFLSNSDAHSPYPHRLGREFNRLDIKERLFSEVEKALKRTNGRKVALNVGLDPREGKYHCTACNRCHQKYSFKEAQHFKWRCIKCRGSIKLGVKDRISQLADQFSLSPAHRPEYIHTLPLSLIIAKTFDHSSPYTKAVKSAYSELIPSQGTETEILLDLPLDSLHTLEPSILQSISKFREGKILIIPGGGGKYGEIVIPENKKELKKIVKARADEINCISGLRQKTLDDFHSAGASIFNSKLST